MPEATFPKQRRFARIPFRGPAVLEVGPTKTECMLLDVSLKGALVEVPAALNAKSGDACSVLIRLGTGDAHVTMVGEVVHVTGNHVGVACNEMDLDSAAHLRRLVELNLGDEALLEREIAALVSWAEEHHRPQ